jgi:hypothetical protein
MMPSRIALAAAFTGAALFTLPATASAQSIQTAPALTQSGQANIVQARWYGHRGYYGRGYYGPRYGYYRRHRGWGAGAGLAAGLATGAIVGSAIAAQQPRTVVVDPGSDSVAYCEQRFKSYDPASGTYLGYDGMRHPCP